MGQQTRKVRRITVHMNAKGTPKTRSKTFGKASVGSASSRSSSPEIPLVVQQQMRLDNIARRSVPVIDYGNDMKLANTFMAGHAYNTRSKTTFKNKPAEDVRTPSVSDDVWEANDTCETPAARSGDHWNSPLSNYGLYSSRTSYLNPTSPVLTGNSAETYFSSSESSISSVSSPPPQGSASIKDPKDPILVTLRQMQRQFSDGISRILGQARRRREWGNTGMGDTGRGRRDGNALEKAVPCQNYANMGKLDELAAAFTSRYRLLEREFIRDCACVGILSTHDDVIEYVDGFEERNNPSPAGICVTGNEPGLESGHEYDGRHATVATERITSTASVSTVIDLQD